MLLGTRAILLISALVLTVLEFQLDASLLSPALPQMAASLGVSIAEISNVRSAFFLAASVLGMVISRWSDTIGRHRALFVHQDRSEEHTSELQSRGHLVCRLLLEKKNRS